MQMLENNEGRLLIDGSDLSQSDINYNFDDESEY